MINVVVKKEGVKSRTNHNSDKDLYQKLVVIGIIVVLVVGVFLFVNLKGAVVGKAWAPSDAEYLSPFFVDASKKIVIDKISGYCYSKSQDKYYAPGTIFNKKLLCGAFGDFKEWIGCNSPGKSVVGDDLIDDNSAMTNSGELYNSNTNNPVGINTQYYCGNDGYWYPCFSGTENTVRGSKYLCVLSNLVNDNKWLECQGDETISNNKFYCDADKSWKTCGDTEKISDDKKAYCKDGTWTKTCTNDMANKLLLDKKVYCGVSNTNIFYCSNEMKDSTDLIKEDYICSWDNVNGPDDQWHICDKDTTDKRINENKYYCDLKGTDYLWNKCTIEGTASNDGEYFCNGDEWTQVTGKEYCPDNNCETCDAGMESQLNSKKDAYCHNNQWEICADELGTSSDKKVFCDSKNAWTFCTQKDTLASGHSDYFCDGTKWSSCSLSKSWDWKGLYICTGTVWSKCSTIKLDMEGVLGSGVLCPGLNKKWLGCNYELGTTWTPTSTCPTNEVGKSCEKTGLPSSTESKKYYCQKNYFWADCNSNTGSSIIQETASQYWQCLKNGIWTEKICAPDKKDTLILNITPDPDIPLYRCDGTNWKLYEYVNKDLIINANSLFEVTLNKNKKIKKLNDLSGWTLCDTGTELLSDRVTYCLSTTKKEPITSFSHLTATGEKLVIDTSSNEKLTFLYEKEAGSENKVMSIVLVKDITSTTVSVSFPAGNFYQNFLSQQRLVLLQESEYYLLSYPKSESFKLENLELYHLPDLKKYQPKSLALGSMIEFPTEAGKVVTIEISGNTVKISSQKSALVGTGVVYSADLFFDFEKVVDVDNPINLLNPKLKVGTKEVTKIYICDKESLAEYVKICYNNESNEKTLSSLSYLQTLPKGKIYKETIDSTTQVALIYGKQILDPKTKNVKIILAKDISDKDATFDSDLFAKNLREKKRLVINLKGEDYLLSHPEGNYFSYASLTLRHLPTWNDYPLYLKGPVYLPSLKVNGVQFKVFDQLITIYQIGDNTNISSKLPPGEATFYAPPLNLEQSYETSFSKGSPVELVDHGNTIVSVCDTDNAGDPGILQACQNDQSWITLIQNNLTKSLLSDKNLVLLYQSIEMFKDVISTSTDELGNAVNKTSQVKVGTKKQGYVFFWKLLSKDPTNSTELNYNNFIDNLLAGRRLAFEFQGKMYLLQHPVTDQISLPSLSLNLLDGENKVKILASGSEKKVTFSLPDGGRITLFREFTFPPPPFKVFAQTKQEIADIPVDLTQQLYTDFSSKSSLNIIQPKFGIISVDSADIKGLINSFKLISTSGAKYTLNYKVPKPISDALFYYNNAYVLGTEYVKSVKIYQLYDLSKPNQYHTFNDQFIETFTSGNELALKFENNYYLLGYKGATGSGKSFFELGKMSLKLLNGSAEYAPEVDGLTATFNVAEGNLEVTIDDVINQIKFSTITAETLKIEEFSDDEFSHQLITKNKVIVGGSTLSICSQKIYGNLPNTAGVCINDKLLRDQPIENYGTFSFQNNPYLLEVNSETGDDKIITIRKIIPITNAGLTKDWEEFSQHLMDKDQPIVNLSGMLYLPSAEDDQLENFGMQEYGQVGTFYPENLMKIKVAVFNGTFVLNDQLLFAKQTLVDVNQRNIFLKLEDYKIVPYFGKIELNEAVDQVDFVTKINGKKYHLDTSFFGLIHLYIKDKTSDKIIISKYFKIGDIKYVTLDGVQIKIEFATKEVMKDSKKIKVPIVLISRS